MDVGNPLCTPGVPLRTKLRSLLGDIARLYMPYVSRIVATVIVLAALSLLVVAPSAQAAPAQAESVECECVGYVRNAWKIQLPVPGGTYAPAENMADAKYMRSVGFYQIDGPTSQWGIVVFSHLYPGIYGPGHVGLIAKATPMSGGWKLTVRGANQASDYAKGTYSPGRRDGWWEEKGCLNVSDWTLANPIPYGDWRVTFWRR